MKLQRENVINKLKSFVENSNNDSIEIKKPSVDRVAVGR